MEFRVTDLDGKVVVITGGARGMGAAYVRSFLAEGANVTGVRVYYKEEARGYDSTTQATRTEHPSKPGSAP